jgi:hypothetical protein
MDERETRASTSTSTNDNPFEARFAGGRLRATVDTIRGEVGADKDDLVRQIVSDYFALDCQNVRTHFDGRLEYVKHVNESRRATFQAMVEYGLQTLKWSFLLNAGAIVVVMAYIGAAAGKSGIASSLATYAPVIREIWPFAAGCFCVTLAGAAGYFNFAYYEAALPSSEALNNFLPPTSNTWPIAQARMANETAEAFTRRFLWKVQATRNAAILLALGSVIFFGWGIFGVLSAVLN